MSDVHMVLPVGFSRALIRLQVRGLALSQEYSIPISRALAVAYFGAFYNHHKCVNRPTIAVERGNLGLIRAVEKFDPHKGFYCSTYTTWRIRQNMKRVLMNHRRIIRLLVFLEKALKVS